VVPWAPLMVLATVGVLSMLTAEMLPVENWGPS
jgi:hypothetical protein